MARRWKSPQRADSATIDERPAGRVEMIRYFEKLIEAKAFQIGYEALGKE